MDIGGGVFGCWRRIDHTEEQTEPASFRPTGKMERASIFVESCPEPVSRNAVTDAVAGNAKYARVAVETLVRERHFRSIDGPRGAKLVESIRPYRESTDPILNPPETLDCVPTASAS